ncbi:MAG: RES family NAD+ phosphorylase [Thiohalomonadales bacterium]
MDIWQAVRETITPEYLQHQLLRVVESQEQIATNSLVDDLEKQAALEDMLEASKPTIASGGATLHYLLRTPFRYPPLPHGSRFAAKHEPSLYYGSWSEVTAFAETAYYRFLFWYGMSTAPPSKKLVSQHTIFSVQYKTKRGLKLQNSPFNQYQALITDRLNYANTQNLGHAMREHGITAFEYLSARDSDHGINAALFHASALASTEPNKQRQWICETSNDTVKFYSVADQATYSYSLNTFLIEGELPGPAI